MRARVIRLVALTDVEPGTILSTESRRDNLGNRERIVVPLDNCTSCTSPEA